MKQETHSNSKLEWVLLGRDGLIHDLFGDIREFDKLVILFVKSETGKEEILPILILLTFLRKKS
jgi:hypothetical protein